MALIICFISLIFFQHVSWNDVGAVPSIDFLDASVEQNFDSKKFSGKWYQLAVYPASSASPLASASVTDVVLNLEIDWYHGHKATIIYSYREDGKCQEAEVFLYNTNLSAKYEVEQTLQDKNLFTWWVVTTDYTSYAVVYMCQHLNDVCAKRQMYVLGRLPSTKPHLSRTLTDRLEMSAQDFILISHMNECEMIDLAKYKATSLALSACLVTTMAVILYKMWA